MKNQVVKSSINLNRETQNEEADYARPAKAFREVISNLPDDVRNINLFGTEQSRAESRERIAAKLCRKIAYFDELPVKVKGKRGQGTVAPRGTATKNPTAPSVVDFRIDVMRQVWKIIRNPKHRMQFVLVYLLDAGEGKLSKADQHVFARYGIQIGRAFMRAKIWPVRSYFVSIRDTRKPAVALKEAA